MSYQEAIQWLGRSTATLHRWIQQGQLTPLPDSRGKSHWFVRSAVIRYLFAAYCAGYSAFVAPNQTAGRTLGTMTLLPKHWGEISS
jgi:hypothetical protein